MKRSKVFGLLGLMLTALILASTTIPAQDTKPKTEQTALNKVEGLELPPNAEYDAKQKFVRITPKFLDGWTVKEVKYIVVSVSDEPLKFEDLGEKGLILALPPEGQSAFVYTTAHLTKEILKDVEFPYDAMIDGKAVKIQVKAKLKLLDHKMTDPALTVVATKSGGVVGPIDPKGPTPGLPDAVAVPPGVKNLHVILVFDVKQATPDLGALTRSTTLRDALKKSESLFYAYDKDDPLLVKHKILPLVQDLRQLPCLIVISGNKAVPAGKAHPFPIISSDSKALPAAYLEKQLLDITGKAAGGK